MAVIVKCKTCGEETRIEADGAPAIARIVKRGCQCLDVARIEAILAQANREQARDLN